MSLFLFDALTKIADPQSLPLGCPCGGSSFLSYRLLLLRRTSSPFYFSSNHSLRTRTISLNCFDEENVGLVATSNQQAGRIASDACDVGEVFRILCEDRDVGPEI